MCSGNALFDFSSKQLETPNDRLAPPPFRYLFISTVEKRYSPKGDHSSKRQITCVTWIYQQCPIRLAMWTTGCRRHPVRDNEGSIEEMNNRICSRRMIWSTGRVNQPPMISLLNDVQRYSLIHSQQITTTELGNRLGSVHLLFFAFWVDAASKLFLTGQQVDRGVCWLVINHFPLRNRQEMNRIISLDTEHAAIRWQ